VRVLGNRIRRRIMLNVSVPPEYELFIQREMDAGNYASPDELVADALSRLQQERYLREKIRAGIEQLDRGERLDDDEVSQRLRAYQRDLAKFNEESRGAMEEIEQGRTKPLDVAALKSRVRQLLAEQGIAE
jgi:Arc/MetJ-type ribon-helix-helix transcriptional regulator